MARAEMLWLGVCFDTTMVKDSNFLSAVFHEVFLVRLAEMEASDGISYLFHIGPIKLQLSSL